ncbi:MaoC/PaaZ C-terminal domain-containing protein [Paraburkholderia tuberum]|uniref:Itaconyl-CoA hydratase n=1 Tax=Paraburkholderia tuberum TaxID=157910 RepID=A0A1H1KH20_9BURK|nr:MaoC/PaaZ C-terminal domain-containing protein [Paraburkholderia tuberum]SDR61621.1 itaconyl-CoA hydratase [Paraburkholderia tuberum]
MFSAYYALGNSRFQERFGVSFEGLAPGQRFLHRPGITFSQQENVDDSLNMLNSAMLHYDERYAGGTAWERPLMVSTWTLQRLIGMTWKTFGTYRKRILSMDSIAMKGPVFGGDTIYAETEVLQKTLSSASALVRLRTEGYNQRREQIAIVEYTIEMFHEGDLPDAIRIGGQPSDELRFRSHRDNGDGTYTEQVGLFFEDLAENETFAHFPRRTILPSDLAARAYSALDWSPASHDFAWAEAAGLPSNSPPQTWLVGLIAALSTRTLGRVVANLAWNKVEFLSDVFAGDTVESRSTITGTRVSTSRPNEGIVTVDTEGIAQDSRCVLRFSRTLLVYRKSAQTPYQAAGY